MSSYNLLKSNSKLVVTFKIQNIKLYSKSFDATPFQIIILKAKFRQSRKTPVIARAHCQLTKVAKELKRYQSLAVRENCCFFFYLYSYFSLAGFSMKPLKTTVSEP